MSGREDPSIQPDPLHSCRWCLDPGCSGKPCRRRCASSYAASIREVGTVCEYKLANGERSLRAAR